MESNWGKWILAVLNEVTESAAVEASNEDDYAIGEENDAAGFRNCACFFPGVLESIIKNYVTYAVHVVGKSLIAIGHQRISASYWSPR